MSTKTTLDDCPVLALAHKYDDLAQTGGDDDAAFNRLAEISHAASWMTPRTKTSAAFLVMLAKAEADLTFSSDNTKSQLQASRAKIDRLLNNSLEFLLARDEFSHAREYTRSRDTADVAQASAAAPLH
jgi:hypothetical protein